MPLQSFKEPWHFYCHLRVQLFISRRRHTYKVLEPGCGRMWKDRRLPLTHSPHCMANQARCEDFLGLVPFCTQQLFSWGAQHPSVGGGGSPSSSELRVLQFVKRLGGHTRARTRALACARCSNELVHYERGWKDWPAANPPSLHQLLLCTWQLSIVFSHGNMFRNHYLCCINSARPTILACDFNVRFKTSKNLLQLRSAIKAAHRDLSPRTARALWWCWRRHWSSQASFMSLESRSDQRERTTEASTPPPPTSPLLTLCPSLFISRRSLAHVRGERGGLAGWRDGGEGEVDADWTRGRAELSLFYASVLFRKGRGRGKKTEPALQEDKDDDAVTL